MADANTITPDDRDHLDRFFNSDVEELDFLDFYVVWRMLTDEQRKTILANLKAGDTPPAS